VRASNSARFSSTSFCWCESSCVLRNSPIACRCYSMTWPSSAMIEGMNFPPGCQ
jgi:hypothetical protein